jgi:alanyl-tRNA synthetase
MKRFDPLTENICEQLREEVTELITPLTEKYGICLDFVKDVCSEDAVSVAINARFSLPKRPESIATLKEEQDFRGYAEGFGMRAAWLGKEFKRGNFTYKVAGLVVNAPKKCVVLQRSDGARSQEDGKLVARYLG